MRTVTANRDLAELAYQHAPDAEPGSLARGWECVAVAPTTTGTTTAAAPYPDLRHCLPAKRYGRQPGGT